MTNKPSQSGRGIRIAPWTAQFLLAVLFTMTGATKVFSSPAEIAKSIPDFATMPLALVRLVGIAELAGAIGLIPPAVTRNGYGESLLDFNRKTSTVRAGLARVR